MRLCAIAAAVAADIGAVSERGARAVWWLRLCLRLHLSASGGGPRSIWCLWLCAPDLRLSKKQRKILKISSLAPVSAICAKLGIFKVFDISERKRLQLRLQLTAIREAGGRVRFGGCGCVRLRLRLRALTYRRPSSMFFAKRQWHLEHTLFFGFPCSQIVLV